MRKYLLRICASLVSFYLFSQSALEYNQYGSQRLAENDPYSALEYFSRAIELNPRYHEALFGMAESYFRLSEYEAALFYIEMAEEFTSSNLNYLNLKARVMIGLSELESAYEIFQTVLEREPYNLAARLGIAEIDLIENRFSEAEEKYMGSLTISPESKRALLSLLLLYDSTGDYLKGDNVLSLLDQYYPYDPDVRLMSAQHFHRKGDLLKAEEDALTLLTINPNSEDVRPLLARIYLEKGEADKSITYLEEQLKSDRENLQLRYLLAVSYSETGRIIESLHNFDYILKKAPYDEISRMTAEKLAIEYNVAKSIGEYSQYHFLKGREQERSFRFDKALAQYRRGLKINPESVEGRLLFGEIYNKQGFGGKYLDILNLLAWNGYDDETFLKKKNQIEHVKQDTLADEWGIDQFYQSKNRYVMDVYIRKPDIQTVHSLSEPVIAEYFSYELEKYSWIDNTRKPQIISSDSEAYRLSHSGDSDFYLILDFFESNRIFSIDASVYLSGTGVLMDSFSILRAGNGKVADSLNQIAKEVSYFLPVRGNIIDLKEDKALINLGLLDGISVESRYLIAAKDKTRFISEYPWYEIADEFKLGILTVQSLDEAVSEGAIENPGFFELVNRGDEIYLLPEDAEVHLESDFGYNETLKRELLRIY